MWIVLLIALACADPAAHVRHLEPVTNMRILHNDRRAANARHWKGHPQPFPDDVTLELQAFGEDYSFDLKLEPVFKEGSKVEVHHPDGSITNHLHRINTYRANTPNGWITATLHDDGTLKAMIADSDIGMIHVERLAIHEHKMTPESYQHLKRQAIHNIVAFKDEHINRANQTCGVRNPAVSEHVKLTPVLESRHLLNTPEKWTNCFNAPSGAGTQKMYVGIAADVGFYKLFGSSITAVEDEIASVIISSNSVYYNQVDVYLTLTETVIKTATDGNLWNQDNTVGCYAIGDALDDFSAWRHNNKADVGAAWGHFTNCYPSGTIGLAWIAGICTSIHGTGVSSYTSGLWLTFAHELGHNFNGAHSFEEGQGSTGGIMDYGDGMLDGIYQFNSQYRKNDMCAHVDAAMNSAQTLYYDSSVGATATRGSNCFDPFADICGDGVISGDETCDTGAGDTSCCIGCQLLAGAECGSGECCTDDCTYAPSTTECDGGYCGSNGACISTICDWYGWDFCGVHSSACRVMCNTGSQCEAPGDRWTSNGVPIDDSMPDGTVCAVDPTSECNNLVCEVTETVPPVTYEWSTGAWSSCSATCGTGTQTRTVQCLIVGTSFTAANSNCDGSMPASSQSCDSGVDCPDWNWETGSWGTCSVTCGPNGAQTRTVTCVDSVSGDTDSLGTQCMSSMPATSQACNADVDCTWVSGEWSACNAECGGGTQTRTVDCEQSTNVWVDDTYCNSGTEPASSQSCNNDACPTSYYVSSAWSSCSVDCGGGTQTRTTACYTDGVMNADNSACSSLTTPVLSQDCNLHDCVTSNWYSSEWGACSAACGGEQTRDVICLDSNGGVTDENYCSATAMPATRQYCEDLDFCYTPRWAAAHFSSCSASCGGGTTTREITCVNEFNDALTEMESSFCDPLTIMDAERECNTQTCGNEVCDGECLYYWWTSSFSSCSATCGEGSMTRSVECRAVGSSSASVEDSLCAGAKPSTTSSCNVYNCPRWIIESDWSECDAQCGEGDQTRSVVCMNYWDQVVSDSECSNQGKPAVSTPCMQDVPCPLWHQGDWSDCSSPCGGGTRTRELSCRLPIASPYNAQLMDEALCPSSQPSTSEACNMDACPEYYYGWESWTACDVDCGGGTQTRTVSCLNSNGVISDGQCSGTIPSDSQSCNTQACSEYGWAYDVSDWSSCDRDCGDGGNQTRDVVCVDLITDGPVADAMCEGIENTLPLIQKCNIGASCPGVNTICYQSMCGCAHGYGGDDCSEAPSIFNLQDIESNYPLGLPFYEPMLSTWETAGDMGYVDILMRRSDVSIPTYIATNVKLDTGNQGNYIWDHASRVVHDHNVIIYYSDSIQAVSSSWGMSEVCSYLNCGDHGSCVEDGTPLTATCQCDDGWSGALCNTDVCVELSCSLANTESCDVDLGCVCSNGYTGDQCTTPPDCTLQCSVGDPDESCSSCVCPRGAYWSGADCDTCDLTCMNDGVFNDDCTTCDCPAGWGGTRCDCRYYSISFTINNFALNTNDQAEVDAFTNLLTNDVAKVVDGWSPDYVVLESVTSSGGNVQVSIQLTMPCSDTTGMQRHLLQDDTSLLDDAYNQLIDVIGSLYFQERAYAAGSINTNTWSAVDEVSGEPLAALPESAVISIDADDNTGLSTGAIVGIIISVFVVIVLIVGVYCKCRGNNESKPQRLGTKPQPVQMQNRPVANTKPTHGWELVERDGEAPYYWNRDNDETAWELPPGITIS